MFKDITLGKFINVKSTLHALDPRVKIIGLLVYFVTLFMFNSALCYIVAIIALFALMKLSNIKFSLIFKSLKSIIVLLVLSGLLNLFLTSGRVVFSFLIFNITYEGIILSIKMCSRLIILIMCSSLLTYTTTPKRLTDAIEKFLTPLSVFAFPVAEISMMIGIALRFVPVLAGEVDRITTAQKSRGADFDSGTLAKKIKVIIPIIVPLFISAFKRSDSLALAMEARCFGCVLNKNGFVVRSKLHPLKYERLDHIAYAVIIVYALIMILVSRINFIF